MEAIRGDSYPTASTALPVHIQFEASPKRIPSIQRGIGKSQFHIFGTLNYYSTGESTISLRMPYRQERTKRCDRAILELIAKESPIQQVAIQKRIGKFKETDRTVRDRVHRLDEAGCFQKSAKNYLRRTDFIQRLEKQVDFDMKKSGMP